MSAADSITFANRGLAADLDCYVIGAVRRETSNSTPDDPRWWQALDISHGPDAAPVRAFCSAELFQQAIAALRSAGQSVPAVVSVRIESGRSGGLSLNVDALDLS